ncbi:hypothetical protein WJX72_004018 [[Myrmecia] bisecta]|uniref:NADP-dependent oxidoreductase domain-containing protein n=1 Tax=[Myrmecia] bisecta TaxID=41462 RepID=A0AAW1P5R9_9CHLO
MVQFGPLKVSPMGLGTWSWGNQFLWGYEEGMDTELQEVFNLVVSSGINLFDTADSYGTGRLNGRSEQLLGQFLAEYPGSARVQQNVSIASKFAAYPWRLTSGQFVGACRASLKRLRQDQLAIGQLHWSTANYAPLQERALWDGLVAMYDEGLVQAVGVSNYGPKQMQRIYKYLAQRDVPLASAQVQFSLLSKGSDQMDILQICQDLGIGVIAYSPLGLGMLTGRYGINTGNGVAYPPGPRGLLFRQILPGARPLLELMQEMASRRGKTVAQVAVNWCICQGTVPIPGAKSLAQAKGTLGALGWRLSGGEVAALSEAADALPRSMVQNIFQTK